MITLAYAHGSTAHPAEWAMWNITADILAGTVLVAVLYAVGLRRRRRKEHSAALWRHWAFFGGLGAIFLALQSPLDALADRSFYMHQLQHLMLQTVAPMLLMIAAPQANLAAGVPAALRPILTNRPIRMIVGFLARPWIAALLLAASLYIWHWPPYHDLAVLNDAVHYLMHVSMLAAGMLFFSVVFDPRPAPLGAPYGTRVNVLWAAMTANVVLGAALSLKDSVLYTAYDQVGRLWEMGALEDEQLGGLIMWIPGSALCVPAFFVLLRMWNSQEARIEARRGRGISSTVVTTSNYRVALWLALVAFVGFAGTLAIGLMVTGPGR